MYKNLQKNKEAFFNTLEQLISKIKFAFEAFDIAKQETNNAEESIKTNWDIIIDKVRELNPNAK